MTHEVFMPTNKKTREQLMDRNKTLVTFPGDEYVIGYQLPCSEQGYEFFLESKGYYLEWMRDEWLDDENLWMAQMLFINPISALKILAPEYKKVESKMEKTFWSSRYAKP